MLMRIATPILIIKDGKLQQKTLRKPVHIQSYSPLVFLANLLRIVAMLGLFREAWAGSLSFDTIVMLLLDR